MTEARKSQEQAHYDRRAGELDDPRYDWTSGADRMDPALRARIQAVMDGQAARDTAQLDALGSAEAGGDGLRSAADAVASAASAERRDRARAADVAPDAAPGAPVEDLTEGRGLRGARVRPSRERLAKGRSDIVEEPAKPARTGFWKRMFGEGDR